MHHCSIRFVLLAVVAACSHGRDVTATCSADVPGDTPLGATQVELGEAALPLSIDSGTGRLRASDTSQLPAWLDAKVLGLGEVTHGTKEVNDLRGSFVLERATRPGHHPLVFLIEDELVRAGVADDYLRVGAGTAASGLQALRAGVWKNRELAALLDRLREINVRGDGANIVFRGIDMQDPIAIAEAVAKSARVLGATVDDDLHAFQTDGTAYLQAFDELTAAYRDKAPFDYGPVVVLRKRLLTTLERLGNELATAPATGVSSHDRALHLYTIEIARQNVIKNDPLANATSLLRDEPSARGWLASVTATVLERDLLGDPNDYRDQAMAENVIALVALEGDDAQGLVWAHNGHIRMGSHPTRAAGGYLKARLGDGYRTIGTEFYSGGFLSAAPPSGSEPPQRTAFRIESSPPTFFANALARLCLPVALVDLTAAPQALQTALTTPLNMHSIGAVYDPSYEPWRTVIGDEFDAVLFIRETSPSQRLLD